MITYGPFRATLRKRNISQYDLIRYGIDTRTLTRLRRDLPIETTTLNRLCLIIGCQPNDIIEVVHTMEEIDDLKKNRIERKYQKEKELL